MAKVMEGLKFSNSHEWVRVEGDMAFIGISDYAQDSLGDVVFIDTSQVGDELAVGDIFGSIESVKAASDLFSPVSGEIVEVNEEIIDSPELINDNPYNNWIIKVKLANPVEVEELMDHVEYEKFINE